MRVFSSTPPFWDVSAEASAVRVIKSGTMYYPYWLAPPLRW
jgi:hypothetical protein